MPHAVCGGSSTLILQPSYRMGEPPFTSTMRSMTRSLVDRRNAMLLNLEQKYDRCSLPSDRATSIVIRCSAQKTLPYREAAVNINGKLWREAATKERLRVLTTWASPFGMRVLVALHEKGLEFEYSEELIRSFSPEVILSNPVHKKIPVLFHNGRALSESRIIVEYIDEQWPASGPGTRGANLMPVSPWDRAQARFWADFVDTKVCDVAHDILVTNGERQSSAIQQTIKNLFQLEKALRMVSSEDGHAMFNGDHLGLVDITLAGFLQWFRVFEVISSFKIPSRDQCPRLNAWIEAVSQEPSVKKAIPDLQRLVARARASRCRRDFEDWNKTYI